MLLSCANFSYLIGSFLIGLDIEPARIISGSARCYSWASPVSRPTVLVGCTEIQSVLGRFCLLPLLGLSTENLPTIGEDCVSVSAKQRGKPKPPPPTTRSDSPPLLSPPPAAEEMASTFSFPEMTPAQLAEALRTFGIAPTANLRAEDIATPQLDLLPGVLSLFLATIVGYIPAALTLALRCSPPLPLSPPLTWAGFGFAFRSAETTPTTS